MARRDILNELKGALGIIPGFAEQMPDQVLEQWWTTAKTFLMVDTALPVKTKALLGVSASSAVRCPF